MYVLKITFYIMEKNLGILPRRCLPNTTLIWLNTVCKNITSKVFLSDYRQLCNFGYRQWSGFFPRIVSCFLILSIRSTTFIICRRQHWFWSLECMYVSLSYLLIFCVCFSLLTLMTLFIRFALEVFSMIFFPGLVGVIRIKYLLINIICYLICLKCLLYRVSQLKCTTFQWFIVLRLEGNVYDMVW